MPFECRVVTDRGDVDDAGRARALQPLEQQVRQVEVPQMVHAERVLEALRGELALGPRPAGVVHQNVEAPPARRDLVGRLADRRQVGEVERDDVHVVVPCALRDLLRRRLRLGLVPAGQHGRGSLLGDADRRLEPDPGVGTGDDDDLALHAHGDSDPSGCADSCRAGPSGHALRQSPPPAWRPPSTS